jgi:hypothetical protein
MKVRLLTSVASANGTYNVGDDYECASAEEAARFVERGLAVAIVAKKTERAVKVTPAKEKRKHG